MRSTLLVAGTAAAIALATQSVSAQTISSPSNLTTSRGAFALAPHAGYLLSQRFVDGPLGTSLNVAAAPMYGVQLSLPLAPSISLIGTVAHASGDLEAGLPIVGGISFGSTSTTVFDAGVELRLVRKQGVMPLVQFGGGATRRSVTVAGVNAATTDFQVSAGIGADIPLTSNLALRILARDHYGRADFGSVGSFSARTDDLHAVALTGGLRIAF
jgi:hypothetical protein